MSRSAVGKFSPDKAQNFGATCPGPGRGDPIPAFLRLCGGSEALTFVRVFSACAAVGRAGPQKRDSLQPFSCPNSRSIVPRQAPKLRRGLPQSRAGGFKPGVSKAIRAVRAPNFRLDLIGPYCCRPHQAAKTAVHSGFRRIFRAHCPDRRPNVPPSRVSVRNSVVPGRRLTNLTSPERSRGDPSDAV